MERLSLCHGAAEHHLTITGRRPDLSHPAIFLSFDDGLRTRDRALKAYFQNLLCPLLGVRVVYPFSQMRYQQTLWRSDIPHR